MVVFLSYASDHRDLAEQVKLALASASHEVFLDRHSLPAGDDYHNRIRESVERSDALVFLVSPDSVRSGSYALTELKFARRKWPDPRRRVLPVMIEKTPYQDIPNYLKAVTILEPEGNAPAEIVAELSDWKTDREDDVAPSHSAPHTPSESDPPPLGRQIAGGVVGAFGAVMIFMSVVDAGVAGISEGGLAIGAVCIGIAYGLWPRKKRA